MKKCILSAIAGALAMLVLIIVAADVSTAKERVPEDYEHIDYTSTITREKCYICSDTRDFSGSLYWGEDNVGIVNLNSFDLLRLEINRYDDHGNLLEEPAGYMSSSSLSDEKAESYVHAYCHPDNAYADVQLSGVEYTINRNSVQNYLCQACLDSINDLWFTDQSPAEYAVVSFENRTIRPLLNVHPWFSLGNFGIDCEFKTDGEIDLLIHYALNPYLTER